MGSVEAAGMIETGYVFGEVDKFEKGTVKMSARRRGDGTVQGDKI